MPDFINAPHLNDDGTPIEVWDEALQRPRALLTNEILTHINKAYYRLLPNGISPQDVLDMYTARQRSEAKGQLNQTLDPAIKRMLAVLGYVVQELNTVKDELARLRADVRASLPTVPAVQRLPRRTLQDALTAVQNLIDQT